MGKGKKQKEKKVVSLAEFNASMGLDPLKPLELQSLPTAPKGETSEQRDFSKVRREGGRGFRKEDESGVGKRRPMERRETDGVRDLDWSQARQGKPVEKEADLGRKMPVRDVDFSSVRQGSQVIGEDAVETSLKHLDRKGDREVDRDLSFRRQEAFGNDSKQEKEKDFSNLRKRELTSQVGNNNNTKERELDFSSVRQGTNVIEVTDSFQPKKTGEVDFGSIRKNAQPISQSVRDTSDKTSNIDFTNARSGSRVISSVPLDKSRMTEPDSDSNKQDGKRSLRRKPQSEPRDLDFSKLRIRE